MDLSGSRMDRNERALLRRIAREYVRAEDLYEIHSGRGNHNLADAALARMQTIENSIRLTELNAAWRHERLNVHAEA